MCVEVVVVMSQDKVKVAVQVRDPDGSLAAPEWL
jgi:hypothetical protein